MKHSEDTEANLPSFSTTKTTTAIQCEQNYFTDKRGEQATILQYYSSFKRIFRGIRDVYTISSRRTLTPTTHDHMCTHT